MAAKLKKGDRVIVRTGKDKGRIGTISGVNPKTGKAIVDNVNMVVTHTKQSQKSQGGKLAKAMPIPLSNLAMLDMNESPTRVGFRFEEGKKVRYAKTTGETLDG